MARLVQQYEFRQALAAWQTRTLAQFIAATVPIEKGKSNPLMKEAEKVGLDLITDSHQSADPVREEPKVGSMERLLRGFS